MSSSDKRGSIVSVDLNNQQYVEDGLIDAWTSGCDIKRINEMKELIKSTRELISATENIINQVNFSRWNEKEQQSKEAAEKMISELKKLLEELNVEVSTEHNRANSSRDNAWLYRSPGYKNTMLNTFQFALERDIKKAITDNKKDIFCTDKFNPIEKFINYIYKLCSYVILSEEFKDKLTSKSTELENKPNQDDTNQDDTNQEVKL